MPLPKPNTEPLILSAVVRSLTPSLLEHDIDPERLYRKAGISAQDVARSNGEVPFKNWLKFLDLAASQANNPIFGIHLSRSCGPETLGAIGYLILSAKTALDALLTLGDYINLVQGSTLSKVIQDKYETTYTYQIMDIDDEDCRQDVEFSVALTKRLIRIFSEGEAKALAVNFRHSPQVDRKLYERQLKVPVFFNQDFNGIVFPKSINTVTGKVLDPNLAPILRKYLDDEMASLNKVHSFTDQVSHILHDNSVQPPLTANKIAFHMGISEPTLYRRLREKNVKFSELLDKRNFHLSKEYLETTRMAITEIAQVIGFSESASFSRAFSRWSGGITPSQFRKNSARFQTIR